MIKTIQNLEPGTHNFPRECLWYLARGNEVDYTDIQKIEKNEGCYMPIIRPAKKVEDGGSYVRMVRNANAEYSSPYEKDIKTINPCGKMILMIQSGIYDISFEGLNLFKSARKEIRKRFCHLPRRLVKIRVGRSTSFIEKRNPFIRVTRTLIAINK